MVAGDQWKLEISRSMFYCHIIENQRKKLSFVAWMKMVEYYAMKSSFLFLPQELNSVLFMTCKCEPLAISIVRAHLWPASSTNLHYAFCFSLLDWGEALLLECQVSIKGLCEAL